jgi:hypothetical protein
MSISPTILRLAPIFLHQKSANLKCKYKKSCVQNVGETDYLSLCKNIIKFIYTSKFFYEIRERSFVYFFTFLLLDCTTPFTVHFHTDAAADTVIDATIAQISRGKTLHTLNYHDFSTFSFSQSYQSLIFQFSLLSLRVCNIRK